MFKNLKIAVIIATLFASSLFGAGEVNIDSKLSTVKVFLRGAELSHSASVNLNKGMNEVVFSNLPAGIDQSSIQVSAKGDGIILSVVQRTNYLKAQQKTKETIMLEDSLRIYKYALGNKQNEKDVLNAEIDLLLSNKVLSGKDKNVSVGELKSMAEFFNSRLTSLKSSILDADLAIAKTQNNIRRIENQLNEINKMKSMPVNEIIVTVSAKSSGSLKMDLSYMIFSAGWSPKYDVRVNDINYPAQLFYNADVWQSSGIDWNDASIILSTRDARQGGSKPELYPWFIDFENYYGMRTNGKGEMLKKTMQVAAAPMVAEDVETETMADYISVNQNQLAVEFVPSIKYSIPSDGKPHIVMLQEMSVPAAYEYYCAPKFDSDAFLIAYLTEWSEYNLLPGKANIYFENSFVGNTFINPNTTEEKMSISLGRDKNIIVSRNVLQDFTEDKFLSSDIERIFGYEFSVRNNKKSSIKLVMEDQIPISQNEDIEVELKDKSGAELDKNTGIVKWKMEISPAEIVKKKFVYSVRYPKDKIINGF